MLKMCPRHCETSRFAFQNVPFRIVKRLVLENKTAQHVFYVLGNAIRYLFHRFLPC